MLLSRRQYVAKVHTQRVDLPTAPGALLPLLAAEPGPAVLESTAYHPEFGRYSILACRPLEVIALREGVLRDRRGRLLARGDEAIWAALEDALACVASPGGTAPPDTDPARPPSAYSPGWIGYVGYEIGRHVERLPGRAVRDTALPDLRLAFHDALLVYDATEHTWQLVSLRFAGDPPVGAGRAEAALLQIARRARDLPAETPPQAADAADAAPRPLPAGMSGNFTAESYRAAVRRCVDYIVAGDIFQVNLSQRLEVLDCPRPVDVYLALRRRNPAWYAAYLSFRVGRKPCAVVSSSPELFLRVTAPRSHGRRHEASSDANRAAKEEIPVGFASCADIEEHASVPCGRPESAIRPHGAFANPQSAFANPQSVLTRPIKGTRPRTSDADDDAAAAAELWASPKDNAELAMIIDLLRNDLGRVCRFGSIGVVEPRRLETHPTVYHLVGTVAGELRSDVGPAALLRATLPGGSITGAPKVRAMEIIDELENAARGVYTGCIGIVGVGGRSEWNIAIRTIVCDGRRALVQAGGGIVADSDPAAEHRETLDKARALLEAIEAARGQAPSRRSPVRHGPAHAKTR